jgi:DUF4097 and DUF4098 domain-containing protein YvlB
MLRSSCLTAAIAVLVVATPSLTAQSRNRTFGGAADTSCDDGWNDWNNRQARHCEIRETTIGGSTPLDVDAGPNGGIRIRGWDRSDVLIRAKITAYADTDADARRVASGVQIETAARVRASGPSTDRYEHWSVSFDIQVPRRAQLTLNTRNGGIAIDDFRGIAQFRAQNGGVSLARVGGDIRGTTTNGGVTVDLEGDRWDGAGLDVETRNGGVRMTVPERYSAELETGTTNGGISIDFPITVSGNITRRTRHITTTLGSGGPRVRVMTTNGGVTVRKR